VYTLCGTVSLALVPPFCARCLVGRVLFEFKCSYSHKPFPNVRTKLNRKFSQGTLSHCVELCPSEIVSFVNSICNIEWFHGLTVKNVTILKASQPRFNMLRYIWSTEFEMFLRNYPCDNVFEPSKSIITAWTGLMQKYKCFSLFWELRSKNWKTQFTWMGFE